MPTLQHPYSVPGRDPFTCLHGRADRFVCGSKAGRMVDRDDSAAGQLSGVDHHAAARGQDGRAHRDRQVHPSVSGPVPGQRRPKRGEYRRAAANRQRETGFARRSAARAVRSNRTRRRRHRAAGQQRRGQQHQRGPDAAPAKSPSAHRRILRPPISKLNRCRAHVDS